MPRCRRAKNRKAGSSSLALRFFDHLEQCAEGMIRARFRVNEKHRRAARARPGRRVNNLEPAALHGLERALRTLDAEGYVRHSGASTVFLHDLLHWRLGAERLQQL